MQFQLADMATEIEAGRNLVYKAAWLKDQGRPFALEAAMAKLYTGELSHRAANSALQIHGGYGFMEESADLAALPRPEDPRDRRGHERGAAHGDRAAPGPLVADGTVTRPDGRRVAYATWGDPDGRPLLQIHGTPGSRLSRSPHPDEYVRAGAHVVTFDRPGYGQSSPWRDRTVLDIADDALAVADALGWERFSVLGISGGGPHALALGVRAPERIVRLGVAVGGTPGELIDPDDLIEHNREGLRRVREEGRESLEEFMAPIAEALAADTDGRVRRRDGRRARAGPRVDGAARGPRNARRGHQRGVRERARRAGSTTRGRSAPTGALRSATSRRRSGSGTASSTATSRSAPSGR